MNELKELLSLCKCGVSIYVNDYKNAYESVEDAIKTIEKNIEESLETDIATGIMESENIIEIHCYPFTPISSLTVYHYDINMAIQETINSIIEWQKEIQMP